MCEVFDKSVMNEDSKENEEFEEESEICFEDTGNAYMLQIRPKVMKVEDYIENFHIYDKRHSLAQCMKCSKTVEKIMYDIASNDDLNEALSPTFNRMRVQLIRIKVKLENGMYEIYILISPRFYLILGLSNKFNAGI